MLQTLRRMLPPPIKTAVRSFMFRTTGRHWLQPALVGRGTVGDYYYWMADGTIDTNVLLNNFYSVFYPERETATTGTLTLNDPTGKPLGTQHVSVGHMGCVKLRVSDLLDAWCRPGEPRPTYGSMLFTLEIPPEVLSALEVFEGPFYFWHRFYIEYVRPGSQPAFVHCVDKTMIHRHGGVRPTRWYPRPRVRDWAPEMPLNIEDYQRLYVIMINRTVRPARMTLTVADCEDRIRTFEATVRPDHVHRFELNQENLRGLNFEGLRMRLSGMPTTWARPILFKEFTNGTISTMHC